jgi:hypothetical protein
LAIFTLFLAKEARGIVSRIAFPETFTILI